MSRICVYDQVKGLVRAGRRRMSRFAADNAANTIVTFALTLPILVAAAGMAVDYSLAAKARSNMQAVADSAALASVTELQLARSDESRITAVANNFVNSALQDVSTTVKVDLDALTVQVGIDKHYTPYFRTASNLQLHASATAKMSGTMPLCLLGLDPIAPQTIGLQNSALLTAPGCLVQSNSKGLAGLQSLLFAVLKSGMTCSSGGVVLTLGSNYVPMPTTDCPVLPDPLRSRVPPSVGACNYNNMLVNGGNQNLQPGVYCGGLKLTNGATGNLASGVYIIKDGPLIVDAGASISGTEVGFFLKGNGSNITFDANSTVNLAAPKTGPLAGILIFDDPSGAPAPAFAPLSLRGIDGRALPTGSPRQHQFYSDNARNLLGTIYMPKGEIIIDATQPIADRSAYTVLVVQQIHLYSGPNLVLNTNYSATDVPVPMGVGPYAARTFLAN
jgi:Flp pilus assembly protein TadG